VIVAGHRSAEAARALGFRHVIAKDGGVAGLARLAAASLPDRRHPLLYLAGEDRAGNLEGELAAEGLAAETVVVYRAVQASKLPPAVEEAVAAGRVDGVLHFSRRSAEAFLASGAASGLAVRIRALRHYCMSAQVAEPLKAAGAVSILVAQRPDEAAVLGLIGQA
jgi:uroporphyrinogen-III synthase